MALCDSVELVLIHCTLSFGACACRVSYARKEGRRDLLLGAESAMHQDEQICRHKVYERQFQKYRAGVFNIYVTFLDFPAISSCVTEVLQVSVLLSIILEFLSVSHISKGVKVELNLGLHNTGR